MTNEELKGILDEFKSTLPKSMSVEDVNKAIDAKFNELSKGLEGISELKQVVESIKAGIVALESKMDENKTENKTLSVKDAIVKLFEEKNLKSIADCKAVVGNEYELKADNPLVAANQTGTIGLSQMVSNLRFAPIRPYAFINNGIRVGTVENGKNIIYWNVGTKTQNVAYIGELTSAASTVDGSTLAAAEKTRKMSKVVGRAIITTDSFEDLPQLAQRVDANLMEGMELWLDQKIWDGAGNDSTLPTQIYGVKTGQVTAFDATLIPKVSKANVGDLADAAKLQAKLSYHNCNTVWMSETLAFKLQRTKDTEGQYVINKLVDGTMMMAGLKVITTELFGGATEQMLVGDPLKIQYWVKRALTAEIIRVPDTDSYGLYVYARQQVLVEDEDIKGLIYIDNVDTALAAIAIDEA